MRRVKTSTKVVKDEEMIRIFNQMMGQSDPEPEIIMPKYDRMINSCQKLIKIVTTATPVIKKYFPGESYNVSKMESFIISCNNFMEGSVLEKIQYSPPSERKKTLEDEMRQSNRPLYDPLLICEAYSALKDSIMIKEFIRTFSMMSRYKDQILDGKIDFVLEEPGADFTLLSFSPLNFKSMYCSDSLSTSMKDYLTTFCRVMIVNLSELYKITTSPDVDVEKFSEVLVRNITKVKGQIQGCDRAFDKITNSIGLLKNNFAEYHKDFLESGNPGIIIENFVGDVAKNSSADVKTTAQFGKIINFYRNKMQGMKNKNPQITKLFSTIDENYKKLEEAQAETKDDSDSEE